MKKTKQQLYVLAENVFEISLIDKWDIKIKIFTDNLNLITKLRKRKLSDDECIALRKLTEELIKQGINEPVTNIKSYKRNQLFKLTSKAKKELEKIPYIQEPQPEINNINDWVKSLKIYKLQSDVLSENYYKNSYELYQDIRKIVLSKTIPNYKKIYVDRVIDKLEEGQDKLPQSINLKIEDYELSELIRLIKNNPNSNYRLKYKDALIKARFERIEWKNNLLLMVKR